MKKALIAKLALAGTVGAAAAMIAGTAAATDCNFCHTMHNSQGGVSMRFDNGTTPLAVLLRGDCVYCHSGNNTAASLLNSPPKVYGTAPPTYDATGGTNTTLAGGDFYWVTATGDTTGHNVDIFDAPDSDLGNTPPGGADLGLIGGQLQCAGTTGCHGSSAVANALSSLQGAHHAVHNGPGNSLAELDGSTVGSSYRYLLGVTGIEDTDWEFTYSASDHNVYLGESRSVANVSKAATAADTTISAMCARCHGAYHNTQDGPDSYGIHEDNTNFSNGNWVRHPTDYSMPLTGEYLGYAAYSAEAPVGKTLAAISNPADQVNSAADRIVLCVTCHRAHGSPYDDALRWDYTTMDVGSGLTNGCFTCHSNKN